MLGAKPRVSLMGSDPGLICSNSNRNPRNKNHSSHSLTSSCGRFLARANEKELLWGFNHNYRSRCQMALLILADMAKLITSWV